MRHDPLDPGPDLDPHIDPDAAAARARSLEKGPLRKLAFHLLIWPAILAITTYLVLFVRFHSGTVKLTRNLAAERNAQVLAVPEAQRAWTHYRRIALALPTLDKDLKDAWGSLKPGAPLWPAAASYLDRNAPLIEQARRATELQSFGAISTDEPDRALEPGGDPSAPPPAPPQGNPPVMTFVTPALGKARFLARTFKQDALLAIESSSPDRAVDDIASLCRMARQIAPPGATMIDQLVGMALLATACDVVQDLIARRPGSLDDARLASIDAELAATLDALTPLSFRSEADFTDDYAQRVFTDDGAGGGYVNAEGFANIAASAGRPAPLSFVEKALGPYLTLTTSRREFIEFRDQLLGVTNHDATLPLWQRDGTIETKAGRLLGPENPTQFQLTALRVLAPAFDKALRAQDQITTSTDCTRAAIVLEKHRLKHGAWPDSTAALNLVTDTTRSPWPTDPFDGAPIRYRVTDGWPVLYSIGANRRDDAGALPPPSTSPLSPFSSAKPMDGDWILFPPIDTDDAGLITTPGPWPADRRAR